jgi:uncharacterized membrane protein
MRSFQTSLLWSVVILLVITASANADRQLIDLGLGYAYSINNSGQIAGSIKYDFGNMEYAALFDATGKLCRNIAPIYSGNRLTSKAYSINNNNQVVGYSVSASIFFRGAVSFLFDASGAGGGSNLGYSFPPPAPTANPSSTAWSINDNGWIVGDSSCNYSGQSQQLKACLFRDGLWYGINLGDLGGGYSCAYSINNNNQIVGFSAITQGVYRACLFDFTGGGANENLGTFANYERSYAFSINNVDQIVGYAYSTSSYISRAVLFDATGNGANVDLCAIDGYDISRANYINDLSQIVGSVSNGSISHACLFDSTGHGNNIDLNTLVTTPSGWWLSSASCINNNGWIVGSMTNGSIQHAFLLTPEPATVLLFALGGATILRKRSS